MDKKLLKSLSFMIDLDKQRASIERENTKTADELIRNAPLLSEADFWKEITRFKKYIKEHATWPSEDKKNGAFRGYVIDSKMIPRAISEYTDLLKMKEKNISDIYTYILFLLSFIATYLSKARAISKPLRTSGLTCNDDGLMDIMDSFPLFGPAMYKKALAGLKGDGEALWDKFYQGENYIGLNLQMKVQQLGQYLSGKKEIIAILIANKKDLPMFVGVQGEASVLLEKRLREET